jgi:UDP-N-acetylglucosamine--N-acetylmuramyl-(pentapeptide) pyrophosphoryl-undecaprenol N-acetylglucosamine transferase
MNRKILITGGHAGSTAYSLIQEIKKTKSNWDIIFVGAKSAIEGTKFPTLENFYFPKLGIKYISIIGGRIQRKFTIWTIPSLMKIPLGFLHAFIIIIKEKPSVVVSFGGYSAFPVVVIAKILAIPVIIHEQTFSAGRSNLLSSYFADKIALARYESIKYFPKDKCIVVGNPISNEVSQCDNKKVVSQKNSIFITGGSRGSSFINGIAKEIIPRLLKDFTIYHQTGNQCIVDFKNLRSTLDKKDRIKYYVFPTVEMWKWYKYLNISDFIISRSGANIVSETVYLSMPSIFIPIPYSYQDEQYKNAMFAKSLGLAHIFNQNTVKPKDIYREIIKISRNWKSIVERSKRPQIDDSKASEKLLLIISEYA